MEVKKVFKVKLVVVIFSFSIIFGIVGNPRFSFPGMPVDWYCLQHIDIMQLTLSKLNGSLTESEFENELQEIYDSYGTTEDEYILYTGKHSSQVNAFLESHPSIFSDTMGRMNYAPYLLDTSHTYELFPNPRLFVHTISSCPKESCLPAIALAQAIRAGKFC